MKDLPATKPRNGWPDSVARAHEPRAQGLYCADRATGELTTVADGLGTPVDLTLAPDGTLYVADFGANRIVRVAGGAVTQVVAAVGPNSVAVDATGVVYFTERTRPHVLRLDPATGRVTLALGR